MADTKTRRITPLRLPEDLRARIDQFAADTNRTLLGACTQLLTEALDARELAGNQK